jgi:two-component system, cell cycle response regulator
LHRAAGAAREAEVMSGAIKVLLIEHGPADGRATVALLGQDAGLEVTLVERPSEAIGLLGKGRFHAILVDLMLPDASGLAAVSSIHDRAPDLPIIVCGGFHDEDAVFAREAVRCGAQDFLSKSLATPAVLRRTLLTSIERKRLERQRIRHAGHDPLTGLANRLLLAERYERAVARAERQGHALTLLAIEPDHYPRVLELMGAEFSDLLLCAVADRMKANVRRSDTLARVRERGFVALLEGLNGADAVDALANKLSRMMGPAFRVEGYELYLTASAGIAVFPTHGRKLEALVEAAEGAMSEVILAGGNGCRLADLPHPAGQPPNPPTERRRAVAEPVSAGGQSDLESWSLTWTPSDRAQHRPSS